MTTPGEALAGAVARHVASRDAMATLAAEIEAERADAGEPVRGVLRPDDTMPASSPSGG